MSVGINVCEYAFVLNTCAFPRTVKATKRKFLGQVRKHFLNK